MTESIGYIFAGIARLMRRRFDEMSRDTGITSPQWRVLVSVHCNPGINQGTLADMLDVEPITTCRMVDRLEQAGLVERRHDPNDRRAWQIFLTDAAMPLIDGMKDRASLLNTAALAGLTKSDQNNLVRMLDTIRQNLNGMVVDTKEARHG
ncbi:MAG TPA: MarR family transcriptional regulator [Rhizorhapis sp.]|jgi:DNA-binding MarR family transcriptional regulator